MDAKRARGQGIAWLCIASGALIILYAAGRFATDGGWPLAAAAGLPVLVYGVLMLRAVRRMDPP